MVMISKAQQAVPPDASIEWLSSNFLAPQLGWLSLGAGEQQRSASDFLIAFQLSEGCCGELNLTPKSPRQILGTTLAAQLRYETNLLELLFAFTLRACTVSADNCAATEDRDRNPKTYRELSQQ